MSQQTLIDNTLSYTVERLDGIAVAVVYTHQSTGLTETVRCIPQDLEENTPLADKRQSYIVFHSIKTDTKPDRGDSIVFNDERYYFKELKGCIAEDTYDVIAYQKDHRPIARKR